MEAPFLRRRFRVASSPWIRATTMSPEDAGVDHRVPGDLQDEVLAGAQDAFRHRHAVAFLLDRLDGRAGGDLAEDGELAAVVGGGRLGWAAVDELGLERSPALGRGGGR